MKEFCHESILNPGVTCDMAKNQLKSEKKKVPLVDHSSGSVDQHSDEECHK